MTSAFLSHVGPPERSPLRWFGWLALAATFGLFASFLVLLVFQMIDPAWVALAATSAPLPEGPGRLVSETRFTLLAASLLLAVAMAVLYAARLAFRRPARTFIAPTRPFRLRVLLLGFVLFGSLATLAVLLEAGFTGEPLSPPVLDARYPLDHRLLYAGGAVVFLLIAALAEEIVCRGVLLQLTAGFTRRLPVLLLVNGAVFSALHFDPAPDAFVARAASGAVWAWTALRLAGIDFAVGAHLANNLVLSLLVKPISEGVQTGREMPPSVLALDLGLSLALVAAVLAALRSPVVRSWTETQAGAPALAQTFD
ncbi:MAG: CPBP family intramembrane metalloprotease [Proteobacteria bacterium]|nr:CPBP family intramembrane metalloprotease [Pseudomonadota bacterium]MBW3618185.1 CPBP family intramembrane metalloprotease [Pseudomonadota bacterium]